MPDPKQAQAKPVIKKLSAKYPPFVIQPTAQVVTDVAVPVEVDGWVQANIDAGLLIECS